MPRVPSAAAQHIGELIRGQRTRMGLTQDELAVRAGIDSANVRTYENGRALMNLFTLVRVADALALEPGELLDGITPSMFPSNAADGRRRASKA
nr:helix-turn-helix transcriptional regulator [Microbacterium indicum]